MNSQAKGFSGLFETGELDEVRFMTKGVAPGFNIEPEHGGWGLAAQGGENLQP